MILFTSYYASKKLDRAKHLLVRTSVGVNRWCPTDEFFHLLAPHSEWIGLPLEEYAPRYLAMLEGYGVDEIKELMELLWETADEQGKVPVLLCYEALKKPGEFCHRRIFAEWYESQTGLVIPEL
jgi:hypothetical protein